MLEQVGRLAVVVQGVRLAALASVVLQGAADEFLVFGEAVRQGLHRLLVGRVALCGDGESAQFVPDAATRVTVQADSFPVRRPQAAPARVAAGQQDVGGLGVHVVQGEGEAGGAGGAGCVAVGDRVPGAEGSDARDEKQRGRGGGEQDRGRAQEAQSRGHGDPVTTAQSGPHGHGPSPQGLPRAVRLCSPT
ncbi:hypothetical protein [Streptomyces sp. PAN_FS17]|uniref:hypothetical protein n=1 Tax=Streptomyces sp. PAN_FS17 TaxID=1855351 RepID=UPI000B8399BF|nr:hypothetical protein [Streptomyces sp. PAN_FS17]